MKSTARPNCAQQASQMATECWLFIFPLLHLNIQNRMTTKDLPLAPYILIWQGNLDEIMSSESGEKKALAIL